MVGMGGGASRGLEEDQQPQHFEGLEQLPCSDCENKQLTAYLPVHPRSQLCSRMLCYLVRSPISQIHRSFC